jgi:hypothetical protein
VTAAWHLDCVAFGVAFQLEAEDHATLEQMRGCVPLGTLVVRDAKEPGTCFAIGHSFRVLTDGMAIGEECMSRAAAIDVLRRELMVHVAEHAPGLVFVHAGVVGWKGRALVLPGVSFAGKTTLVAELMRAGAAYYSDEYAVIGEDGLVHPYARELQMRVDGGIEQRPVRVEELQGANGSEPLRVGLVAFAEYAPGAKWMPEFVSAGTAALEMMRHAIPVQHAPQRVMATLARMMQDATAVRSLRGEADVAARGLLRMMESENAA